MKHMNLCIFIKIQWVFGYFANKLQVYKRLWLRSERGSEERSDDKTGHEVNRTTRFRRRHAGYGGQAVTHISARPRGTRLAPCQRHF